MKKHDGWISSLFALIFIAVPALIIFLFFLPSWSNNFDINYGYIWLIALSFFVYVALIHFIAIYCQIISIESLNFNVPISISLMAILVCYPLPIWLTFLIVFLCIMSAFPTNILTNKYIESRKKIIDTNIKKENK